MTTLHGDDGNAAMDAHQLKLLYERQLAEDLKPPVAESVDRRATRAMLRASRAISAGELCEEDHAAVWLWSDLHLGHDDAIDVFGRRFSTVGEVDDTLFRNWRRAVDPSDTLVCLGDVSFHPLWGTTLRRVRTAPGARKILVFGNHEVNRIGEIDAGGFDEVYSTLYVAGDPPLLLTHIPLRRVPEGCVNVHGHLHHRRVRGRSRHINVSVEQVDYRPRALTSVRRLAGRLVRGDAVKGRTTAHQLRGVL